MSCQCSMRLCIFCSYIYFDCGTPDYSEYTPGSPPEIACSMGHFRIVPGETVGRFAFDEVAYRDLMQLAKTCSDYEHYADGDDK